MSIKFDFSKKDFAWIGLFIVILATGIGVAYVTDGSGDPAYMGHSIGELEGVATDANITAINARLDTLEAADSGGTLECVTVTKSLGTSSPTIYSLSTSGVDYDDSEVVTYSDDRVNGIGPWILTGCILVHSDGDRTNGRMMNPNTCYIIDEKGSTIYARFCKIS